MSSVVPQDTALFNDSIRNNVWFPAEPGSREDEEYLSQAANLNFVSDWDSSVGERGQTLSGGERQRVALARALARRKPLLLLDEATSALDQESDASILEHLKNSKATVIAVTHRMSAVQWSDRLTVVDEGTVVQEGPTQELLKDPGPVLQRLLTQIDRSSYN
jgi:ATP-binding cassette subfamily B protein